MMTGVCLPSRVLGKKTKRWEGRLELRKTQHYETLHLSYSSLIPTSRGVLWAVYRLICFSLWLLSQVYM